MGTNPQACPATLATTYNEDVTLVDDALLKQGRRNDAKGGAATNWSSATVGSILGKSAHTPAEDVPNAMDRVSAIQASEITTMPSFCATSLSLKNPKDTAPQAGPAKAVQMKYLLKDYRL